MLGDKHFDKRASGDGQAYIDEAFVIDKTVCSAVAEHSVNPQDIKAGIRRELLPRRFNLFGLDHPKE